MDVTLRKRGRSGMLGVQVYAHRLARIRAECRSCGTSPDTPVAAQKLPGGDCRPVVICAGLSPRASVQLSHQPLVPQPHQRKGSPHRHQPTEPAFATGTCGQAAGNVGLRRGCRPQEGMEFSAWGQGRPLLVASISSHAAEGKGDVAGFQLPELQLPRLQLRAGSPLPKPVVGRQQRGPHSHKLPTPDVGRAAHEVQKLAAVLVGGVLAGMGQVVQRLAAARPRLGQRAPPSLPFHQSFRLPWDSRGRDRARCACSTPALLLVLLQLPMAPLALPCSPPPPSPLPAKRVPRSALPSHRLTRHLPCSSLSTPRDPADPAASPGRWPAACSPRGWSTSAAWTCGRRCSALRRPTASSPGTLSTWPWWVLPLLPCWSGLGRAGLVWTMSCAGADRAGPCAASQPPWPVPVRAAALGLGSARHRRARLQCAHSLCRPCPNPPNPAAGRQVLVRPDFLPRRPHRPRAAAGQPEGD